MKKLLMISLLAGFACAAGMTTQDMTQRQKGLATVYGVAAAQSFVDKLNLERDGGEGLIQRCREALDQLKATDKKIALSQKAVNECMDAVARSITQNKN